MNKCINSRAVYSEITGNILLCRFIYGFSLSSVIFLILWIIKVLEGLPNLLRGFREGFTIKTSIVVEGSS